MTTLKVNMVTTQDYYRQKLNLMYEIQTEEVYKDFNNDKEIFDFSNYSTKSNYYDDLKKLVVGKLKDKTACVAIEEFVRLKLKMYSYFVDNNSEHKNTKGVNKNVVGTISHNEYKDVSLNKECLIHSMNGIQSKKTIEEKLITSTRFLFLALMIKYISKTMSVID